jgi:hypothetical protein
MMRWAWSRPAAEPRWRPPAPIPDYDTTFPPGYREDSAAGQGSVRTGRAGLGPARHSMGQPADVTIESTRGLHAWADLVAAEALLEATQPLPTISPLMTRAARWRSRKSTA